MTTSRPPLQPLAGTSGSIAEDRYRHDLELHDRFQNFGGELLRIASLGLAAFGFILVTKTTEHTIATAMVRESIFLKILFSLSPICFGASMLFALAHRFLASDGLFHHFRAIKLIDLQDEKLADKIKGEEDIRNTKFKRSEKYLHSAGISLAIGALFLAVAFVLIVLRM